MDAAKTSGGIDLGANGRADAGDTITYTIVVTNNGSVTLTDVLVGDLLTGTALPGAITWLDGFDGTIDTINVGGAATAVTVTATYTLTQADIDAGAKILNCVDVTGDTNDENDCVTDTVTPVPGVDAAKESLGLQDDVIDNGRADAGETIRYEITVTNTGNTTLANIVVNDVLTAGGNRGSGWLPVGRRLHRHHRRAAGPGCLRHPLRHLRDHAGRHRRWPHDRELRRRPW